MHHSAYLSLPKDGHTLFRSAPASFVVGDATWLMPAVVIAVAGVIVTLFLRRRSLTGGRSLAGAGLATLLRVVGWLLITACLVNPLWSSTRPRQGANVFAVVVDNSRSQRVVDSAGQSRSDELISQLENAERTEPRGWLHRLDEQFEVRLYTLSNHLQRVPQLTPIAFDGDSSRLESGLQQIAERFRDQPLAGILLLTDGNATDRSADASADEFANALGSIPPVYPVAAGSGSLPPDVAIQSVTVSQSAFDDAPVTIQATIRHTGVTAGRVRTTLLDEFGTPIESKTQAYDNPAPVRLIARPETAGTVFYRLRMELLSDDDGPLEEATVINNTRLVAVDRGSTPRRVLYVSGRPNWEFKFLRRAVETDARTELTGLIRIARREAKFEFRGPSGDRANSLFRGFDAAAEEAGEEYDEPVLVGIGTRDDELISGFPESEAELFGFDALILDDIEASFFTTDQQLLIREFVTRRGAGLLMLGGQESFRQGEYDRTPIGDMLPLDLRSAAEQPQGPVRLRLTRDGWLQPWVRLRSGEDAERGRLQSMPAFRTINAAARIRPGAQVMASIADEQGTEWPALVVQRFGRGRSAAMCVGDLWRWRLHEGRRQLGRPAGQPAAIMEPGTKPEEDRGDYARAARQMIRWLVSDVPRRLTVDSSRATKAGSSHRRLSARVRGDDFLPREDADVVFEVTRPDGSTFTVSGRPADDEVGRYDAMVVTPKSGSWKCEATATMRGEEDRVEEFTVQHGWAHQPDQSEMKSVQIDESWMESLAKRTGGRVLHVNELSEFVDELETSDAPVMEVLSWPVWHQWSVFVAALICFVGDWTIRRRLGYP